MEMETFRWGWGERVGRSAERNSPQPGKKAHQVVHAIMKQLP